jgi:predicted small lipoprotein YifL
LIAGLTVLALGLSGCGRKGPLDPPPGASAAPGTQQAQTQTPSPAGIFVAPAPAEESQAAEAAKGPKRRIFLDGLLN